MRAAWVANCLELCKTPADFYSGSRKIIQDVTLEFPWPCTMTYESIGYTNAKKRQLERNYLWQESIDMASMLWNEYRSKPKYRSVTFSTFGSLLKDHHGPRGSRMGPCLLGVVLTMDNKAKNVEITLMYRTTEIFKKFAADLVFFSDLIQKNFNLEGMNVTAYKCYFANITVHPAYFVILLPHLKDPIKSLDNLKTIDKYFFDWCVKWSSRYLIDKYGHGIQKFSQALQVQKYARSRITDEKYKQITEYLEANHPGYTRSRFSEEGEEDVD